MHTEKVQVNRIAEALMAIVHDDSAQTLPTLNDISAELLNEMVADALESPKARQDLKRLDLPKLRGFVKVRTRQIQSRTSPVYSLRSQLRRHVKAILENDKPTEPAPNPASLLDEAGHYVVARIRDAVAHVLFSEKFRSRLREASTSIVLADITLEIWRTHECKFVSDDEMRDAVAAMGPRTFETVQVKRDSPKLKTLFLRHLTKAAQEALVHAVHCLDAKCIRDATGWSDSTLRRRLAALQKELQALRNSYDLSRAELKSAIAYFTTSDPGEAEELAIEAMAQALVDADAGDEEHSRPAAPDEPPTYNEQRSQILGLLRSVLT